MSVKGELQATRCWTWYNLIM